MDKVLVGMPGRWATDYSEPADHFTSKIGGLPDWPFPSIDAFEPGLLECSACCSRLALVSQVYAPVHALGMNIEERTLYVLGCVQPQCGDTHRSWRAIRLQKTPDGSAKDTGVETSDSKLNVSAPVISFLDDDEDDDLSLDELSKAFKDLATMNSHSGKENTKKQEKIFKTSVKDSLLNVKPGVALSSAAAAVLPCFYLYTQEEPSAKVNKSKLPPLDENQFILPDDAETWDNENYEYDNALSVDRTYLKYKKVIDHCPEQCFRYKYAGNPLLASKTSHKPSPCQHCGAPRRYEMQLMPPLVYFLHEGAGEQPKYSLDNWNWMTLIIYTCAKNCSSICSEDNSISHGWTVAIEEIELQLEEKQAIFSSLLADDHCVSA